MLRLMVSVGASSLGLGGVTSQQMTFKTHSPENLTMAYVLPNEEKIAGSVRQVLGEAPVAA